MSRRERRRALGYLLALVCLLAAGAVVSWTGYDATALQENESAAELDFKVGGEPDANFAGVVGNRGEPVGLSPDAAAITPITWEQEQYLARAWPGRVVPARAVSTAQATWRVIKERKESRRGGRNHPFVWELKGPSDAVMPGVLSFSGAEYHASGRTTALAMTPSCERNRRCTLWIGAAGGGIWRTNNPYATDPTWFYVSSGFGTNAIGTLDQDPTDSSGMTLYAGTGEPNASGDSEAGVGIYKTTNGGDTWELLPGSAMFATRSIGKIAVDPTNSNHHYVAVARGIRGYSSVTGGAFSRTGPCVEVPGGLACVDGPDQAPLGLYETTNGGQSYQLIWNSDNSVRGANDVGLDPLNPSIVYVSAFQKGIWRRDPTKGENSFVKVFETRNPDQNTSRTQFDLTVKDGQTRIYAHDGSLGPRFTGPPTARVETPYSASSVWRADAANSMTAAALLASETNPTDGIGWDAKSSPTDLPRSHPQRGAWNLCTGQCWYDIDIYTPRGENGRYHPDIVYALGSYSYGELAGNFPGDKSSNGRGVVVSQTAGEPTGPRGGAWNDVTWAARPDNRPDQLHPDHHEILTPLHDPLLFFSASDGGVVVSDGDYRDDSQECVERGLTGDLLIYCQRLLSRIPERLNDSANKGLSTLQYQSVALHPNRPLTDMQGGTQDNGTHERQNDNRWPNVIYGDGGNGGYDYCNPRIRFNTFFTQATDSNFRNGEPTRWVVTSGPLFNSGEVSSFYGPIVADEVNCGHMYIGLNHVWRTPDNGGDQAYLEANCPEFTTSAANPACGDWKPLGGPQGFDQPGDLTGLVYGPTTDRYGGTVVQIERNPADRGTIWAATSTGRVFVTRNGNAPDPNTVVWCRLDTQAANDPPRFVTSIHADVDNLNRAYIAYNGYNTNTPATPGHVFELTVTQPTGGCATGATWRNLNVEPGSTQDGRAGDLPVVDLVQDDLTGDLYASTDFGVIQGEKSGNNYDWARVGAGLPRVETPGLTIDSCQRVLYAATHGRSIWRMFLEPTERRRPREECPRTP